MSATSDHIAAIAAELSAGRVVAVPTETVYGLAVDPTRPGATARLFALKQRPEKVALALLVPDLSSALALIDLEGLDSPCGHGRSAERRRRRLLERFLASFWPGPLTVVVPRARGLALDLGGDEATIGLRLPAHRELGELLCRVGPLAVTSANRHGDPPCRSAAQVRAAFPTGLGVLDTGDAVGTPSTVLDLTAAEPRVLRDGGYPSEQLLAALEELGW